MTDEIFDEAVSRTASQLERPVSDVRSICDTFLDNTSVLVQDKIDSKDLVLMPVGDVFSDEPLSDGEPEPDTPTEEGETEAPEVEPVVVEEEKPPRRRRKKSS